MQLLAKLYIEENIEGYFSHFRNLYKIAKDTKSRDFQYRQLIFNIYLNSTLFLWKVLTSDKCNFCEEVQTLCHLFWECEVVNSLLYWLKEWSGYAMILNFYQVFVCRVMDPINHVANHLILIFKQYIFKCKCQDEKPTRNVLKNKILMTESMERIIAKKEGKMSKHCKKWSQLVPKLIKHKDGEVVPVDGK